MKPRARGNRTDAPQFETFSTAEVPAPRRATYWNRLLSSVVTAAAFEPADSRSFSAELTRARVGELWLAEMRCDAGALRVPSSKAPRKFGPMWSLQLVLEGESSGRQWGRETRLNTGDFALFTSASQDTYESANPTPLRKLIVAMPRHVLRRYVPYPEAIAGVTMPGDRGVSGLASTLLTQYWSRCRSESAAMMHPQVVHGILELVASAYASVSDAGRGISAAASHRARAVEYIESHLCEPDLAPGRVAAAMQMTTRNLHYTFAHERETVSQYIVRRRLEASVGALIGPRRPRAMTGIALDFGFVSAVQYGRAFRRVFGMTPGAYRRHYRSPGGAPAPSEAPADSPR